MHNDTQTHWIEIPWLSDRPVVETSTCNNTQQSQKTNIHDLPRDSNPQSQQPRDHRPTPLKSAAMLSRNPNSNNNDHKYSNNTEETEC
jgi:hypothetical protein